jgi:transcriptional regulator with XRE-family HTH domain
MLKRLFGQRLKQIREMRGMTQEELAETMEIADARTIRYWESGRNSPNIAKLEPLAKILGVKVEDFFKDLGV